MKKVLFTGAHHNSALALLDWMKANTTEELEFIWVGRKFVPGSDVLAPEYKEVSARNIRFFDIKAGKLYRFTDFRFIWPFLKNLFLIPGGFITAYKILSKEKPQLIVSFGGYIAVPVAIVGWLLGIRSVSHEQTLSIGLANQIIYLFTRKIYTAWPIEYYPSNYRDKMSFVGLPLKEKFLSQVAGAEKIDFADEKPVLYVTGGKNGSHVINSAVIKAFDVLIRSFNIIWACGFLTGKYNYDYLNSVIKDKGHLSKVLLKEYFGEDEIGKIFNTADIVVSRSGAHTVYELMYLKKPSLLIPIPWSSNNEQYKNALLNT